MNRKFLMIISGITLAVFFVYLLFISDHGLKKHRNLNLDIEQLNEKIANANNQINNTSTFEQLQEDTAGILERYAREELNLQRSNEDVFVVTYESKD